MTNPKAKEAREKMMNLLNNNFIDHPPFWWELILSGNLYPFQRIYLQLYGSQEFSPLKIMWSQFLQYNISRGWLKKMC
jgi:hypothetical protein